MIGVVIASIPSPPSNKLGPFNMYGLMIAIGVVCGVWLARRRWFQRGGDPEDISTIALWAVPAGLIGARLYHVITDNQDYRGNWLNNPFTASPSSPSPFAIWQGGLGIPGGILVGVSVGLFVAYKKGLRLGSGLDAITPALPLAQAIGRFGNYFNQELYGRPTDLPWGLEIDHPTGEYAGYHTFHPTFLYEALWNIGLMFLLIWIDKKRVLRPGRIFVLYIGGYFLGRLWVESLRSDTANLILGLRVNIWTSLLCIAGAVLFFLIGGVKRRPGDSDEPYRDGHRFELPPSLDSDASAVGTTRTDEPASDEPASDEPASDEPASGEPASGEPAAGEPAGSAGERRSGVRGHAGDDVD